MATAPCPTTRCVPVTDSVVPAVVNEAEWAGSAEVREISEVPEEAKKELAVAISSVDLAAVRTSAARSSQCNVAAKPDPGRGNLGVPDSAADNPADLETTTAADVASEPPTHNLRKPAMKPSIA